MGRYIDEILQPDEKVLFSTTIHWVTYVPGVLAWVVAIAFLMLLRGETGNPLNTLWLALFAITGLFASYLTFRAWFDRWTKETDVTNLRVVHKEGFIKRDTFEMNLDRVESIDVEQSIPGRILGYGNVVIRGVGDGGKVIKKIAAPLQFRNHITAR
ncbi:MAG: PH domain-containing protein [Hyphomicrobiales bacterium]|nr:MAG: PH domain-containing protein [Hyphomicrobiales bacterium]